MAEKSGTKGKSTDAPRTSMLTGTGIRLMKNTSKPRSPYFEDPVMAFQIRPPENKQPKSARYVPPPILRLTKMPDFRDYHEPKNEIGYSQIDAYYKEREAKYDQKNLQKYRKINPMNPYKHSMIGAYKHHVLGQQLNRVVEEEYQNKVLTTALQRKRKQEIQELQKLRQEQANYEMNLSMKKLQTIK